MSRVTVTLASGAEPRERIDVDPIIQVQVANTQISTRRYGSDPTRTELNPVRSMLEGIMMQPDLLL